MKQKAKEIGLNLAIKAIGSKNALASGLGINRQSVQNWRQIPAERVISIEKLTGIPRDKLRPDLYPK